MIYFQVFDRNRDGFITAQEIRETMEDLGIHLEDEDIKEMLDTADKNHDGKIDYKGTVNKGMIIKK